MKARMKPLMVSAIFIMALILNVSLTHAQSLDQLVQQLQEKPDDFVLREQIIKLAQKDKPGIPEEARRHFVKGTAIAQSARDAAGQKLAVRSFEEALKIAPWWSDAYYNLAIAQELAGQMDDARSSLEFYILTDPGETEAREAKDRIYALEGKEDLAKTESSAQKAAAEATENMPQKREEKFLASLEGAIFSQTETLPGDSSVGRAESYYRRNIAIRGRQMILTLAQWYAGQYQPSLDQGTETDRVELTGKVVTYKSNGDIDPACNPITLTISHDGSRITHTHTCFGRTVTQDYFRAD